MTGPELWEKMMDVKARSLETDEKGDLKDWYPNYVQAFATVNEDTPYSIWNGHNKPSTDGTMPKGTRVRVVMASRFGDVGITRSLHRSTGYERRVDPEILTVVAHFECKLGPDDPRPWPEET